MLKDYPKIREAAYNISTVLGVLLSAVQVGFVAANAGQPLWLTVTLAVYLFLSGALGKLAATNITHPSITVNGKE